MKKRLLICLTAVALSVLLGLLLLAAVLCIPADWGPARIAETSPIILDESPYPLEAYSRRQLDNFTDCLMLLEAADNGTEPLLERAIQIYHTAERGRGPDSTVADPLPAGEAELYRDNYTRYWHGFIVFLRPAFALLGYNGIRTLNLIFQHALLLAVLLLIQRKYPAVLLPFLLMILFWAPTAIGKSLQFSSVYDIVLLSLLLLLWNPKNCWAGERACWLFLPAGILVAYLDLLTAPTTALTAPLVLLLVRERQEGTPPRQVLRLALRCVLLWLAGYAGMWAGKWLIALLYTRGAFLRILLNTMHIRTAATNGFGDSVSRGRSLWVNVKMLLENRHLVILTGYYTAAQFALWVKRGRKGPTEGAGLLLFLLPVLIAAGWNLVMSNHSTIHCWFTYRTLGPALFSLLTALSLAAQGGGKEGEMHHG